MAEASPGCAPAERCLPCRSCTTKDTSAMRSFASWARPMGCCAPSSIACSAARERRRIGCRSRPWSRPRCFARWAMRAVGGVAALRQAMESASSLCARVLRLGSAEEPGEISAFSLSLGEPGAERLARELAERSEELARRAGRRSGRCHAAWAAALSGRRLHRRAAHPRGH